MTAIDIVLIRRIENFAPVAREGHMFYFEVTRCEKLCASPFGWNGVKMKPAVALPREDDPIAIGPEDLRLGFDSAKRAAWTFVGAPDFARRTGLRIGYANRPRACRRAHRADTDDGA